MAEPPEPHMQADHAAITSADLREAVLRLEPRDRAALFCFFYLDLSMPEVARVLRVSQSAARARVYRAARQQRPELPLPQDVLNLHHGHLQEHLHLLAEVRERVLRRAPRGSRWSLV